MAPQFVVGQEILAVYRPSQRGGTARVVRARISTVGRRWVTFADGNGRRLDRFDPLEPCLEIDGGDWASPGRVYISDQDYKDDQERQRLADEIAKWISIGRFRTSPFLDLEPMRQFVAALERAQAAEEALESAAR